MKIFTTALATEISVSLGTPRTPGAYFVSYKNKKQSFDLVH